MKPRLWVWEKFAARVLVLVWASYCVGLGSQVAEAAGLNGPERAMRIEALLAKARQALAQDRLTVPAGDNAVGYAQRVLDLAPHHPEAQQLLRDVVARYAGLGQTALDRVEEVRAHEAARIQTYQARGARLVQDYKLPDAPLRGVDERLSSLEAPASGAVGTPEQHPAGRQALIGAATRYATLSEAALETGNLAEAQHYKNVAEDLVVHYQLPDPGLSQLAQRIAQADQASQQTASGAPAEGSRVDAPGLVSTDRAVFLPPSF